MAHGEMTTQESLRIQYSAGQSSQDSVSAIKQCEIHTQNISSVKEQFHGSEIQRKNI